MLAVVRAFPGVAALVILMALLLVAPARAQRNLAVEEAPASSPNRVALVIGNSAYPGVAALRNPANDANDIAARLTTLGFTVTLKKNVPLREMLRTLTQFGDSVRPGSEALFFYAGHGMQVRGKNFLIPVDAEIRSESAVSSEAIDVDQLLDKLSPARLSMVILDACRNNPFERRFRGGGQGLASINAPTGTLIAYATAPGKVASDGDGKNGLYTQELLAAMSVPGIKIEDVFKRVRVNVVRKSGDAQVPWESSSLTGDFYFRPPDPQAVATPGGVSGSTNPEMEFWNSVDRSNSIGDYQAYLKQYPNGSFEKLARSRIAMLQQLRDPGAPAGDRSWDVPPVFHVGDRWQYTRFSQTVDDADESGYTVRMVMDSGTTMVRANRDGNPLTTDTATSVGTVKASYSPYMPVLKFPLKTGKTWRETYVMNTSYLVDTRNNVDYSAKVAGWENITVPAGTFEALRIDWQSHSSVVDQDGSTWYAPEVKGMVKSVTRVKGQSTTVELNSYSVRADTPAR